MISKAEIKDQIEKDLVEVNVALDKTGKMISEESDTYTKLEEARANLIKLKKALQKLN